MNLIIYVNEIYYLTVFSSLFRVNAFLIVFTHINEFLCKVERIHICIYSDTIIISDYSSTSIYLSSCLTISHPTIFIFGRSYVHFFIFCLFILFFSSLLPYYMYVQKHTHIHLSRNTSHVHYTGTYNQIKEHIQKKGVFKKYLEGN